MPKESRKTVKRSSSRPRVCKFDSNELARSVSDDVSSILLTLLQWPQPLEGRVSLFDLSADNFKSLKGHNISLLLLRRRTKDRLHYSKRYGSTPICKLGLKQLCTMRQPDPESVTIVELSTGSGEVVEEEHAVIINRVRVQTVISIHHRDYGFVQVPGDVQAAGVNSICHPDEFSVNAIGPADLARTQLDTIDTTYRQTFSAFNTFVCGITTVCLPTR